jgi:hypothetical protein
MAKDAGLTQRSMAAGTCPADNAMRNRSQGSARGDILVAGQTLDLECFGLTG